MENDGPGAGNAFEMFGRAGVLGMGPLGELPGTVWTVDLRTLISGSCSFGAADKRQLFRNLSQILFRSIELLTIMGLPSFPKITNVYFLAIVATMGGMLFGFDISSMSAIIGTDQYM